MYTVEGYLSDVCLYQYLERDQTKRERIKIKCKRKYAWLKVPLKTKKTGETVAHGCIILVSPNHIEWGYILPK